MVVLILFNSLVGMAAQSRVGKTIGSMHHSCDSLEFRHFFFLWPACDSILLADNGIMAFVIEIAIIGTQKGKKNIFWSVLT
jgi:hypothetical protein